MQSNDARGEICFLPRFTQHEPGGVAVHVRTLKTHLAARGWQIVAEPGPQTIIHTHAMARAPEVHVHTCHGIYPLSPQMPAWQRSVNTDIFANIKLAEQSIAVSQWSAAQWAPLTGRKPHIIYNGVNPPDWLNVPAGYWRGRLQIPATTPLVLWGKNSLSAVLDPTPLLELALRFPTWRFVAPLPVGALPSLIKNVTCVGALSFEAMQRLLADCDVYLATVQENHSIQALEAALLGKPILGYAWAGTAETFIRDGQQIGGTFVPPHDMRSLAQALPKVYAERQTLGVAGHDLVTQRFTLDMQLDALEEVYAMTTPMQRRKTHKGMTYQTDIRCSIIIPVYNKAAWVAETIRSARYQIDAPKYEIIVVNDGSTDDSLMVARSAIAGGGNHMHVYDIPNGGVAAARNFGISHAKGAYIACLDADDLIDPHFLQRLSAALDADPGLGIAYSDFLAFGNDERGMPFEAPITCDEYDFNKLKGGNILPCCNLFRKVAWERAGGYKPINPSWEDYELWLNMGKLGWYGQRVPGLYFKYRKIPKTGRDFESHGLEWRLRATVNRYHRDLYAPYVTFVVPCYQHSQFLREALDSIIAQTFPDWEIIVVDDGNSAAETDRIAEIVYSYQSDDIRLIRHLENQGLAAARNTGCDAARGTWLVPLDADDKLAPTYLETCLRATEFDPKRFAYCDTVLWWPDGTAADKLLAAEEYDFDQMLAHISWSCTTLFARQAWLEAGGYKLQMSQAGGWEDWEYAISLGENGVCGVHVKQALLYYRQHSGEQMRHKAEANKPALQETMRRLHAPTYRGERPAMCCGAGKKTRPANAGAPPLAPAARNMPAAATVAAPAEIILRYVGSKAGTVTWAGPTGKRYRFGIAAPVGKVDPADVYFLLETGQFIQVTQ